MSRLLTEHPPRLHRWKRSEYYAIAQTGVFDEGVKRRRVELIDGVIVDMAPQHNQHAQGIVRGQYALMAAFGPDQLVRVQLPLYLDDYNEPEPDFAVVPRATLDSDDHPRTAELVVEVADSSLRYDTHEKRDLYARFAIPEYWVVNLVQRRVEVYRDPTDGIYRDITSVEPPLSLTPLCALGATLRIADMLP